MAATTAARPVPAGDRLARGAERLLRVAGDGRTGLLLLGLTGAANVAAAVLPGGPALLDGAAYAVLLGALGLSGVAAVAVRAPAAWREWRRPGLVAPGAGALDLALTHAEPEALSASLRDLGYRTRVEPGRSGRWAVHGVRRGWSRFAGHLSHLALVVLVLGAAIGAAFGTEQVVTLLPGDQALLDDPRPGFSSAVRLDAFDAEFGADARPRRLDTAVTFLRGGEVVRTATLRVNEPGDFDGYLVHPWTYGPAATLRVQTLGGSALLDATLPLEDVRDGLPVGAADLPSVGLTLGLAITDPATNELGISVVDGTRLIDAARVLPGESARIGPLAVTFRGFEAWVTLMSRSDPGLAVLFAGAALLSLTLAVAFWLPRRRLTVRPNPTGGARLVLRGERFDRPADELDRLRRGLGVAA
jgi:ResB-like family